MTNLLRLLLGIAIFGGLCLFAEVADPGDGTVIGGGTTDTPEPPPEPAPATPDLTPPATGDRSDDLRDQLESTTTLDPDARDTLDRVRQLSQTVDTTADGHRPGSNRRLRTQLQSLRDEAALLEQQLSGDPNSRLLVEQFRADVENTIVLVRRIDAAIENSNVQLGIEVSRDAVNLLSRGFGRSFNSRTSGTTAGDLFSDWQFSLTQSYAEFDDSEAGGDGDDQEYGFFASALMGESFEVGFGISQNHWMLYTAANKIERNTTTPEAYLNYVLNDTFSFGFFLSYSETDVEDEVINAGLAGAFNVADQFGRWSTGISASAHRPFGDHDLGVTTALVSANKSSLTDTFDTTDSAAMLMLDLQSIWSDQVSTAVFATYYTLVDRESTQADGSFWFVGGDVSYDFNDRWRVSAGYETTLGMDGFDEHRLNTALEFAF